MHAVCSWAAAAVSSADAAFSSTTAAMSCIALSTAAVRPACSFIECAIVLGQHRRARDSVGDHAQGLAGAPDDQRALLDLASADLHVLDGLGRLVLHLVDQLADLLGCLARALRELAHLIGHDREAASGLAGARGLDGRVEREQVGLVGDRRDDIHDRCRSRSLRLPRTSTDSASVSMACWTSSIFMMACSVVSQPRSATRAASSVVDDASAACDATFSAVDVDRLHGAGGLLDLARLQLGAVRDLLDRGGDLHGR